MVVKELREKTEKELHDLLQSSRDMLRHLRFRIASKEEKDVREMRETRKTIARILTLLSAKK
ncbi:50S ribosomal protein L29 [Candidatus Uhrbacteria bacterium]|nr:50S ribosomal protein L29 [Candidatus Uhrbacteria bacterium]